MQSWCLQFSLSSSRRSGLDLSLIFRVPRKRRYPHLMDFFMKTTFLLAGILLFVTNAVSAEQPKQSELLGVMTRTAHWKFESNDEPERSRCIIFRYQTRSESRSITKWLNPPSKSSHSEYLVSTSLPRSNRATALNRYVGKLYE